MFLKYLSTSDFDLNSSFHRGLNKINNLPKFQKFMTYFWILGPFFYLIERDPADLWLTTISLIFIIRCFLKNNWRWAGQLWFVFAFLLWVTGLLSAILGPYEKFSFFQGLVWIRFPIYVAAAQAWLGKDKDIRMVMFISILIGMIIMCIILSLELFFEGFKDRLSWPYGDLVPGSYLSKLSLPIFCTLIALICYRLEKNNILSFLIVLWSIILVFFSGERGNFLIRFFGGLLSIFSWKSNKIDLIKILIFTTTFFILSLTIISTFNKPKFERYTHHFFKAVPIFNTSTNNPYWGAWRSGIQQGLYKPIIGMGPSSSRVHCKTMKSNEFKWLPGKNFCLNHPHNFYLQLFAETGIVGLIFGTLMIFFLFKTCYDGRKIDINCPLLSICYIIPLAFFFPLQQMGSFFGQWGNLFIWFPIGFCISQIQDFKSIFKK